MDFLSQTTTITQNILWAGVLHLIYKFNKQLFPFACSLLAFFCFKSSVLAKRISIIFYLLHNYFPMTYPLTKFFQTSTTVSMSALVNASLKAKYYISLIMHAANCEPYSDLYLFTLGTCERKLYNFRHISRREVSLLLLQVPRPARLKMYSQKACAHRACIYAHIYTAWHTDNNHSEHSHEKRQHLWPHTSPPMLPQTDDPWRHTGALTELFIPTLAPRHFTYVLDYPGPLAVRHTHTHTHSHASH